MIFEFNLIFFLKICKVKVIFFCILKLKQKVILSYDRKVDMNYYFKKNYGVLLSWEFQ